MNFTKSKKKNENLHDPPSIPVTAISTNQSIGDGHSSSTIFNNWLIADENLLMSTPEIHLLHKGRSENYPVSETTSQFIKKSTSLGQIKTQLLTALVVSWVSMQIGYCSAYTAPASISLERDFKLSPGQLTWITSLMPLGALGGGFLGGVLIENIGRKRTLSLSNLLFFGAYLINYFAQNRVYMYASRVVAGASVGILSLTLPVYLVETVQADVRGTLGLLPSAFGNIGILLCYLCGTFFEWQALALIGLILSIPFMTIFWLIKESPRFLLRKSTEEKSRKALQWLRGPNANTDKEFQELKRSLEEEYRSGRTFSKKIKVLFAFNNMKLMGIVIGLMVFQQWSGINAVISYSTKIFQESGSTLNEAICTTIIGVVNFLSTFIAAAIIDKLGRKVLLYISTVSMSLSLAVLGGYFFFKEATEIDISSLGFLPLASFIVYILGFSLGFGPLPWLLMGEILPSKIRGTAAAIITSLNFTCTFIVTKTFLIMATSIGFHSTFWILGSIVLTSVIFIIFFVPETRGLSLAEMERNLAGIKMSEIKSIANLKPMPSNL